MDMDIQFNPTAGASPVSVADGAPANIILSTSGTGESGDPKMVTSYHDQNGAQVALIPPVALSTFQTDVAAATSGQLTKLQGATYRIQGTMTLDQTSTEGVVLNTGGNPPRVTGLTIGGIVQPNLPTEFQGLTPDQFIAKVSTTFSGPMAALQGASAFTSSLSLPSDSSTTQGSLYVGADPVTGQKIVYGYRDSTGVEQTLNPAQSLQEFLKNVENPTSTLHSLSGKSLSTLEVSFSAPVDAPITICGISPEIRLRASEILPPPTTQIRTNAYLEPSVGAQITILLMTIASLKIEISKEEDRAIIATMNAAIAESQMRQQVIQQKSDAEMLQATAAMISAAMRIGGAVTTIGMSVQAKKQYEKDTGPQQENTTVVGTTAPKQDSVQDAAGVQPGQAAALDSRNMTTRLEDRDITKGQERTAQLSDSATVSTAAPPKPLTPEQEAANAARGEASTARKSAESERKDADNEQKIVDQLIKQHGVRGNSPEQKARLEAEIDVHTNKKNACNERAETHMDSAISHMSKIPSASLTADDHRQIASDHTSKADSYKAQAGKYESTDQYTQLNSKATFHKELANEHKDLAVGVESNERQARSNETQARNEAAYSTADYKGHGEAVRKHTEDAKEARNNASLAQDIAIGLRKEARELRYEAWYLNREIEKPDCPDKGSKESLRDIYLARADTFDTDAGEQDMIAAKKHIEADGFLVKAEISTAALNESDKQPAVTPENVRLHMAMKAKMDPDSSEGKADPYASLAKLTPSAKDMAPTAAPPPKDMGKTPPAQQGEEIAITGSAGLAPAPPASTAPTAAAPGATEVDTTPKPISDTDKAAAVEILKGAQMQAQSWGTIHSSLGDLFDKSVQMGAIPMKSQAEQAEAYLNAFKQLNETVMGQLTNDRSTLDSEFKGTLDALKSIIDREVQNLGQLFGVR